MSKDSLKREILRTEKLLYSAIILDSMPDIKRYENKLTQLENELFKIGSLQGSFFY